MIFKRFVATLVLGAQILSLCPRTSWAMTNDDPLRQHRSSSDAETGGIELAVLGSEITGSGSPAHSTASNSPQPLPVFPIPQSPTSSHSSTEFKDAVLEIQSDPKVVAFDALEDNIKAFIHYTVDRENYRFSKVKIGALGVGVLLASYLSDTYLSRFFGMAFGAGTGIRFFWYDDDGIEHGSNYAGRTTEGIIYPLTALKFARAATDIFTPNKTPDCRRGIFPRIFHGLYSPWYRDANDIHQPGHTRAALDKLIGITLFALIAIPFIQDRISYFTDNGDIFNMTLSALGIAPYVYFRWDPLWAAAQKSLDKVRFKPLARFLKFLGISMTNTLEQEDQLDALIIHFNNHEDALSTLPDHSLGKIVSDTGLVSPEAFWAYLASKPSIQKKGEASTFLKGAKKMSFVMPLAAYAFYKIKFADALNGINTVLPDADISQGKYQAAIQTQATVGSILSVLTQVISIQRFFTMIFDHFFKDNTVTLPHIRKGFTAYAILMGLWLGTETMFSGMSLMGPLGLPEKMIMGLSLALAFIGDGANKAVRSMQDANEGVNVISQRILKNKNQQRAQKIQRIKGAIGTLRNQLPTAAPKLRTNLHDALINNKY